MVDLELKIASMAEVDLANSNAAVEEVTGTAGTEAVVAVAVVVPVEALLCPSYSVVVLAAADADSAVEQVHVVASYSAEEAVAEVDQVGKEAVVVAAVGLDLLVGDSDIHTVKLAVAAEVRDLAALDPLAG